jgi:hypothetical protein
LIQIMAGWASAAQDRQVPTMLGAAMTRSITGKAEVVLEYPDKLFIGTFGPNDHFDARFEANEVLLTLQREDGTEACRAARLHLAPQVLARVLFELADSVSETAPAAANRVALRAAARTLGGALAAPEAETEGSQARRDANEELTPDEEVLLLHVME